MQTPRHTLRFAIVGLALALCLGVGAFSAGSEDTYAPLAEDNVSLKTIKGFFDGAFIKSEFDKDGDLRIEDGGMITFVQVDDKKQLIRFFSLWPLKASVSELKKLQLINTLNDKLILVRFCMTRPTVLWCDYELLYEGGVTPFTIINSYRHFIKVVKGGLVSKDPEDIVGSD